jgi:DNA mismatch repair ATPase MutS
VLKERRQLTANDFCFTGKRQVVITGPNQGGKTTFLRGVGLAQVMAQCGLFVAAREYTCPLFSGLFTHFPGAEDDRLQMGLLETELKKLSGIVGAIKPGGLLLMNESFQTTMPLDAKCLAEKIVSALADAGVTVLFVTHLYAFALELNRQRRSDALLLRAQRGPDGKNTYAIREGEPFKSAAGLELFDELIHS